MLLGLKRGESQRPALLVAYYLTAFLFAANPLLMAWVMGNTGGATKTSTTFSLFQAGLSAGDMIGPLLFSANQAPEYLPGIAGVLGVFVAMILCVILQIGILVFLNKQQSKKRVRNGKSARVIDRSMQRQINEDQKAEQVILGDVISWDITDRENDEFVVIVTDMSLFKLLDVERADAECIARDIEVPANRNGPLYRTMFPCLNSLQKDELDQIIRFYTSIYEDAFEDRQENFLKVCTVDNRPVGFCGWTIEGPRLQQVQTNERQRDTKRNGLKDRGGNDCELETLDVDAWLSLSRQLRAERERVLKDFNEICRITIMSVKPNYQRRGIGSMMMRRICEDADLRGWHTFVLGSPEGVQLYANFGFKIVGGVDTSNGTITSMLRPPQRAEDVL
ncbi:uncharacterized protein PFLUO_LOCUS3767 [Penicillium psychrofluorescens]|uniref:uncharacterized protein n=1 Tax=Penicillium psychrofluorescens TaxID=3158075 RepID=UPI003CCDCAAB